VFLVQEVLGAEGVAEAPHVALEPFLALAAEREEI
jgi:hypothetical protein